MAYVKVEVNVIRRREPQTFYAKGFDHYKMSAGTKRLIEWFDNAEFTGKSCVDFPMTDIGEYEASVFAIRSKNEKNDVHMEVATKDGPAPLLETVQYPFAVKHTFGMLRLLPSHADSFRVSLRAAADEVHTCEMIVMTLAAP